MATEGGDLTAVSEARIEQAVRDDGYFHATYHTARQDFLAAAQTVPHCRTLSLRIGEEEDLR